MKRQLLFTALVSAILSSCAQLPKTIDRSVAAVDHKEPGRGGRYDGPHSDVDRRHMEREPSSFAYCEKYKNDTAKHVLTCAFGNEEAQKMANGFAGGHGREDGFIRGYAWGLSKMVKYAENNPDEIRRGEQESDSLFLNYESKANSEGSLPGSRDGESLGSSEAKGRFYTAAAIDSKKLPSAEYALPPVSYQGVPNAYNKYVGQLPKVDDYLRDERRYGRLPIFEKNDRQYMGYKDHRELKVRDVWSREGEYRAESSRWQDGIVALKIWNEINSRGKQKYEDLNRVTFVKEKIKGRLPAQENRGGKTRPEVAPVPEAKPETAPAVVDFQAIFRDAFLQAYGHYSQYYYTKNYYAFIDDGQREGEIAGYAIGSDIARKNGLSVGFNQRYINASRNAYLRSFSESYSSGFRNTYSQYQNNSILSLNFMGISEPEDGDGVIEPGEQFKVQFKVTNVGGKASHLNYSVTGDITDAKDFESKIDGISTKMISSDAIAEIDNRLNDGAEAKVILKVNEMQEQMWQKIQRPLELADISTAHSILTGSGLYNVILKNISTVSLNGKITIDLKISGAVVKTVVASSINPGEKKSYALDFAGIDPLTWITSQTPVEIVLKYNDVIFGMKNLTLTANSEAGVLASYYDLLINDKGMVPAGKNLDDRINEVNKLLVVQNVNEVNVQRDASGNDYKDRASTTVPGKIALAKSGRSDQSSRALTFYTKLGDTMSSEGKKFKSFLFIHPKRDAYYEILKQISGKKYK